MVTVVQDLFTTNLLIDRSPEIFSLKSIGNSIYNRITLFWLTPHFTTRVCRVNSPSYQVSKAFALGRFQSNDDHDERKVSRASLNPPG